jgi:hypothetical protein
MSKRKDAPAHGTPLTRREALRRGAIIGGSLLWTTPALQTIRMSHAHAQRPSPPRDVHDISYIAMNVTCNGSPFFIKWEAGGGFEDDPGAAPHCESLFTPTGTKADGAALGFTATGPAPNGCVTIGVPAGCTINSAVVFGGGDCCAQSGPVFCPC